MLRPSRRRRLGWLGLELEQLEARAMMFADIRLLSNGVLDITADPRGDTVTVGNLFNHTLVSSEQASTRQWWIETNKVTKIVFHGSGADDKFHNETNIVSDVFGNGGDDRLSGGKNKDKILGGSGNDYIEGRSGNDELNGNAGNDVLYGGDGVDVLKGELGQDSLYGGGGDDRLYGGRDFDYLWGNDGNDRLWAGPDIARDILAGGSGDDELHGGGGDDTLLGDGGLGLAFFINETGNDTIYGDGGNDYIHGARGNDRLFGGAGADRIWGEEGNDVLWGEAGVDTLNGGTGNDGLFGGIGERDFLRGGSGADRFLQPKAALSQSILQIDEDRLEDFSSRDDAELEFWRSDGNWTDAEIRRVDEAFQMLHDLTGNTRLLNDSAANRGPLRFYRYTTDPGGCGVVACNFANDHHIFIGNGTFNFANDSGTAEDETRMWTLQVVIHEIGHNWDDPAESVFAQIFRQQSDWILLPDNTGALNHTPADDNWWYENTAEFARVYGRTNPHEDFATVFEAYVVIKNNMSYVGVDTASGDFLNWAAGSQKVPDKVHIVDTWVQSLA